MLNRLISASETLVESKGQKSAEAKTCFAALFFLLEVITLSYIGFSYIGDVSNSNFPSIGTFFFVFFSLIFTLANAAFFIVYDLFFSSEIEEVKIK